MRDPNGRFETLRQALAASVLALLAATPVLTVAAQPAATRFVPTIFSTRIPTVSFWPSRATITAPLPWI